MMAYEERMEGHIEDLDDDENDDDCCGHGIPFDEECEDCEDEDQ